MHLVLLAAFSLLAVVPSVLGDGGGKAPSAPKANSPTYTMLANYSGQLGIKVYKRPSPSDPWVPHTCNATTFGAACNQPTLTGGSTWEVKVAYAIKNASVPFRTWKNGTPEEVVIRLDYHPTSQLDRGWRKKNGAYPGHGWHAKWTLDTLPWNASGYAVWHLEDADEVTDALLYPEVCVLCRLPDGHKDYCQCNRLNLGATAITVESEVVGSVTSSIRGAAIALSVFSPVLLIVYSISDVMYYKKTGRSLRVAHA